MDSGDLAHEQLAKLLDQVARHCQSLRALQERIRQRRFPYDDELRQRVAQAHDALHGLWVAVHYMACNRAAGRELPRKPPSASQFRIQVVIDQGHPWIPVEAMDLVEGETPLEALAQLARQGRLAPFDRFFARVVLEVDANAMPSKAIEVPLTRELTTPYRSTVSSVR
jgi:hypothetical protein